MRRAVTAAEFADQLAGVRVSAFRLEQQDQYSEPREDVDLARFLAGERDDPMTYPGFADWCRQITRLTQSGVRWQRVRVQQDPPTPYQRWARYVSQWNIAAGEDIRYLPRPVAHEIGLLPAAGPSDWWLLDDERLLVLTYDGDQHLVGRYLVTDADAVTQARTWRDLAVHHASTLDQIRSAAA